MAIRKLTLQATALWDDVRDTVELTFVNEEQLPPPPLPVGATWFGSAGGSLLMTAPVRRAVETARSGIYSYPGPNNTVLYSKVTWNTTTQTWGAPIQVDQNGNPL